MKVLVTGGTGFIGYHTCLALLEAGHSVKLFVRDKDKARRMFGNRIRSIVVGDITSAADIRRALRGCDATIHIAAMVSTHKSDADKVYNTNVAAAEAVLGQAVEHGCQRIVHVSSVTAIYDPKAKQLTHNSPPGTASNAYGRSKVACERYARSLQEAGAPLHITYPASVIGPDAPSLTEPHTGIITNLMRIGFDMPGGNQYVDVRDVARAHAILISKALPAGRFPLGGHYASWKTMYTTLGRLTGRPPVIVPVPGSTVRLLGRGIDALKPLVEIDTPLSHEATVYATQWVRMDNRHTLKTLGLTLRPFEESLIDTIRWLEADNYITRDQAGALSRHNTAGE